MPERVAVVGNRKGADMQQVVQFMDALHAAQPDTIVISGGADGVDQMAESTWFRLGGRIISYRPASYLDAWGIEVWHYGGQGTAYVLPADEHRVQLANYRDAALYRDFLIACECDRLVAFFADERKKMYSGAATTLGMAADRKVPTYPFVAHAADAAA